VGSPSVKFAVTKSKFARHLRAGHELQEAFHPNVLIETQSLVVKGHRTLARESMVEGILSRTKPEIGAKPLGVRVRGSDRQILAHQSLRFACMVP
jgi:hypothetical protein